MASTEDKLAYAGLWRFQVVPKSESTRHVFLHAIEATDSKVTRPAAMELLDGTGAIAAQVGPNVLLLSRERSPLSSATVTVAGRTRRVVVGDLTPQRRYTVKAGRRIVTQRASSAGSILMTDLQLVRGDIVTIHHHDPM